MADNEPLVSVVIPVYNAAAFLPTCFSGLKAQVFQEFEAIFVDDGSTDTTGRILTQAVALEPHFRMIRQNHKNAGSARNKGLQEVKSKYVCFWDVDDEYDPYLLLNAIQCLEQTKADIVLFHYKEKRDNGKETFRNSYPAEYAKNGKREYFTEASPEEALLLGGGSVWNKVYRTVLIREHHLQFDELAAYNDVGFVLRGNLAANKIALLDEYLYSYWYNNSGSVTESKSEHYDLILHVLQGLEAQEPLNQGVSAAGAHYRIKTLLYDIRDYRTKQAEDYYGACQLFLRKTEFDTEKIAAFYPQLNTMIRVFRLIDLWLIQLLDAFGMIKFIREKMHRQREYVE